MADINLVDTVPRQRPPRSPWIKARAPVGENYEDLRQLKRGLELHSV